MTADEHEAQEIVTDGIVDRSVKVAYGHLLLGFALAGELFVFPLKPRSPAQEIDRTMLCGGTSASCARSSARPTSRTIRASPAMSLADSILQTASIATTASRTSSRSAP